MSNPFGTPTEIEAARAAHRERTLAWGKKVVEDADRIAFPHLFEEQRYEFDHGDGFSATHPLQVQEPEVQPEVQDPEPEPVPEVEQIPEVEETHEEPDSGTPELETVEAAETPKKTTTKATKSTSKVTTDPK